MNSIANGNCIMPQQYLFNWNQVLPTEKHQTLKCEADAVLISPQYRHKRTRNSTSLESSFVQVNVSKRVLEQQLRIFLQTSCNATVLEKEIIENSRMLSILKRKFKVCLWPFFFSMKDAFYKLCFPNVIVRSCFDMHQFNRWSLHRFKWSIRRAERRWKPHWLFDRERHSAHPSLRGSVRISANKWSLHCDALDASYTN